MFKCHNCRKLSLPRQKQVKVTLETRPKKYYEIKFVTDESGNEVKIQGKLLGKGWETVKEVAYCNTCSTRV